MSCRPGLRGDFGVSVGRHGDVLRLVHTRALLEVAEDEHGSAAGVLEVRVGRHEVVGGPDADRITVPARGRMRVSNVAGDAPGARHERARSAAGRIGPTTLVGRCLRGAESASTQRPHPRRRCRRCLGRQAAAGIGPPADGSVSPPPAAPDSRFQTIALRRKRSRAVTRPHDPSPSNPIKPPARLTPSFRASERGSRSPNERGAGLRAIAAQIGPAWSGGYGRIPLASL